jgi:thymidylate kinase
MSCDSKTFFALFFRELQQQSIPYVILHSYQKLPEIGDSDIDYAVPEAALPKLRRIQVELARQHGWALVQTIQHGVFACYAVLINLTNPAECLRLDACSSYCRDRRFLVAEKILLHQRIPYRDFFVPAPASEFIYEMAKLFDPKFKSPVKYLPRLKELWVQDPVTAQKYFAELFGETGRTLEQWFASPPDEWNPLRNVMLARNRFGFGLLLRESIRVLKRTFQPTGFCLAVLGSDGAGKSTLLTRLQVLLEPCFRYQKTLHFRPGVLRKNATSGAITDPHARPPRNAVLSWLKVLYYFADNWAGWFLIVLRGKIRSTLVIFDRSFEDLLVDERRYRLGRTSPLVRALRRSFPGPDRTFVLSAPPPLLHQRKPELPLAELERQQSVLLELAKDRRHVLIRAEETPEQVAQAVCREVLREMAAREAQRC